MASDIAMAFTEMGISVTFICLRPEKIDLEFVISALQSLRNFNGPKFLFDFNGKANLHLPYQGRQASLIKEFRIPRFAHLIDHPIIHEHYLGMQHHKTVWGVVARHHKTTARDLAGASPVLFVPHGGPPRPRRAPVPPPLRPIDVLFCGNIQPSTTTDDLLRDLGLADPVVQQATIRALAAHVEEAANLWHSLTDEYTRIGLTLARTELARVYLAIERWVVADRRRAAIANLPASRSLVICGSVLRELKAPDETQHLGSVAFDDFLDLASNARILLNARSTFRDGAHERIFYGLSRGAAILTDNDQFLPDENSPLPIRTFSNEMGALASAIQELDVLSAMRTPERMRVEQADYVANHTWTARLRNVMDFLESSDFFTTD